jgi:hypothetical protein
MASMVSPRHWGEARHWSPRALAVPRIPTFAFATLGGAVLAAIVLLNVPYARLGRIASVVAQSMAGDGGSALLAFTVLMGVVGLVTWWALGPEDPNSWRVRAAVPAGARIGDLVPVSQSGGLLVEDEVTQGPREVYSPPRADHIPVPTRLPYQVNEAIAAGGVPVAPATALLVGDVPGIPPMAFTGAGSR